MLANPARKLIGSRNTTYQGFVHRNTVRDIPRFPISLRSYPADSPLVEKDRQRESLPRELTIPLTLALNISTMKSRAFEAHQRASLTENQQDVLSPI